MAFPIASSGVKFSLAVRIAGSFPSPAISCCDPRMRLKLNAFFSAEDRGSSRSEKLRREIGLVHSSVGLAYGILLVLCVAVVLAVFNYRSILLGGRKLSGRIAAPRKADVVVVLAGDYRGSRIMRAADWSAPDMLRWHW